MEPVEHCGQKRILLDDGNNLQNQVHQPKAPYYVSKDQVLHAGTLGSSIEAEAAQTLPQK
jgi:hypothetical protein